MAKAVQETMWATLPKAEQERIKKALAAIPDPHAGKAKANGKGGFTLRGYVRCELAAADKEGFSAWEQEQDSATIMAQLVKEVDSGYLLKVGESEKGYQASLCAATTGSEWEGYVLTAHASSGTRAASLLVYKHCTLMQRDWAPWVVEDGEDFLR